MGSGKQEGTALPWDAAQTAVHAEPFRESAYRVMIRAPLAEGNRAEALLRFRSCQVVKRDELGLARSPDIRAVVAT